MTTLTIMPSPCGERSKASFAHVRSFTPQDQRAGVEAGSQIGLHARAELPVAAGRVDQVARRAQLRLGALRVAEEVGARAGLDRQRIVEAVHAPATATHVRAGTVRSPSGPMWRAKRLANAASSSSRPPASSPPT